MFRNRLLWVLHFCLVHPPVDSGLTRSYWFYNNKIENITTNTDLLSTAEGITRIGCARTCATAKSCLSFFYTTPTGSCRLHSNRFSKGAPENDKQATPGTKFYTDKCTLNEFEYNVKTGKYVKLIFDAMNSRIQALRHCEAINATLFQVKTPADVSAIIGSAFSRAIGSSGLLQDGRLWLDVMFDNSTGGFTWSDGTEMTASMWTSGMLPGVAHADCVVYNVPASKLETKNCSSQGDTCLIQCCTDDLCNTGCTDRSTTTQTTTKTTAVCRDEPSCPLLMSSYDVCDNIPVARQFCARRCAFCAHSYSTFPTTKNTQLNTTVTTTAPTTTMPMTSTMTTTTAPTTTTTMASTMTTTMALTTTTGTTYLTTKQFVLPTYGPELAKLLYVGAHVVRGKDWKWDDQDGNGEGTIEGFANPGWVHVTWDNGRSDVYIMGKDGAYDLMLVPGSYHPPTASPG